MKEFCTKKVVRLFFLLIIVFFFNNSPVLAYFDFNPTCQQAMQEILDLKLLDARKKIEEEKRLNPDNGYAIYLEHYADAIELLITEDTSLYKRLIDNFEGRMDRIEKLEDGSPYCGWLQAEMMFHTGLAQVKFGTRVSGVAKVLSSYKRIREQRQKTPDFWQDQKLTGMYNILLENIPPYMRWAADLFGFSGNAELGLYQLNQYCEAAKGTPGLAEESILVMNLGFKLAQREEEGFKFLLEQDDKMKENTLVKYLLANSATFTYRNDMALQILSGIHPPELQVTFYSLDYVTGRCKLNHLEPDASLYLEKYLGGYPGLDFKKDVCNRLSYYYLIHGDIKKYHEYKAKVMTIGQEIRDRDQEAALESQSGILPQVELLKARLLCDGGYFDEALAIMKSIDPGQLSEKSYQLEYRYRLGRIWQLNGNPDMAIPELTLTYNEGKSEPYTFATRAAFYLGRIYEEANDYPQSNTWYERCIDAYSPAHTTEGVKDAAEKGEKRIKEKF